MYCSRFYESTSYQRTSCYFMFREIAPPKICRCSALLSNVFSLVIHANKCCRNQLHQLHLYALINTSTLRNKSVNMASSATRMIHQDYIARIRYSNALPPPPNPPKLLSIPNTGLASGQYTTPGFASRLARDQPLNIEADAELGMPLDLVGMPGIFDGDESCEKLGRL